MNFTINSENRYIVRTQIEQSKTLETYLSSKNSSLDHFAEEITSAIYKREIDLSVANEYDDGYCTFCELIVALFEDAEFADFIKENEEIINNETKAEIFYISQYEIDPPDITNLYFNNDIGYSCGIRLDDLEEDVLFDFFGEDVYDKIEDGSILDLFHTISFEKLDELLECM